jgi:hypothetical protein
MGDAMGDAYAGYGDATYDVSMAFTYDGVGYSVGQSAAPTMLRATSRAFVPSEPAEQTPNNDVDVFGGEDGKFVPAWVKKQAEQERASEAAKSEATDS